MDHERPKSTQIEKELDERMKKIEDKTSSVYIF